MIRDPRQTPPWHWEVQGKVGDTAGCVDVGQVREGFGSLGVGAASAPLDETACASFPLRGKDVTTSTHTRTPRARGTHEHVSLTSRTCGPRASLWHCAL